MASEDLDLLQQQFPDCQTLAFADIGTEMVLVTNTGTTLERHALNRLCAEAACTLGREGELRAQSALVCTPEEIRFYLRAADHPDDVLICIGRPGLDIAAFRPLAQAFLHRQATAE